MVAKICERCTKEFPTNEKLKLHLNRKNPCKLSNGLTDTINYQCTRCTKVFQNNPKLARHLNCQKQCKLVIRQPNEVELQALFEKLKQEHELVVKENDQLKTEVGALKSQNQTLITTNCNNKTINNANNNTTNNTKNIKNTNITINVYGKEDLSHITDDMYKQCFRLVKKSPDLFLRMKHFSSKMQANQNMYISNVRDKHMMIYRAGRWDLADKIKTLDNFYYKARDDLMAAYDKMQEKNTLGQLEKMCGWFMEGDYENDEEDEYRKATCAELAHLAYNFRKRPMAIKKIMDKNAK